MKIYFVRGALVLAELGMEPRACELPVAHDGFGRDRQHFGSLVDAQSAEKAQFDDASLARVVLGKRVQGIF